MNIGDVFIFTHCGLEIGLMRECPSMSCVCPGPLLGGLADVNTVTSFPGCVDKLSLGRMWGLRQRV